MKKKQLSNIIMAAIIVVIVAAGVLVTGYIQGWFGNGTDQAVLTDIRGIINIQRDGVAFRAEKDTVLRKGDVLTCDLGATATITLRDSSWIDLGEQAQLEVVEPVADGFSAKLVSGSAVAFQQDAEAQPVTIHFMDQDVSVNYCAVGLLHTEDADTMQVYLGSVMDVKAGQEKIRRGDSVKVQDLDAKQLTKLALTSLRKINAAAQTCFDNDALDKAAQQIKAMDREQGKAQGANAAAPSETTKPADADKPTDPSKPKEPIQSDDSSDTTQAPEEVDSSEYKPESTTAPTTPTPSATVPPTTAAPTTAPPTTAAPETEPTLSCTLSIRCDTILNNMDKLDPEKVAYVPSDGWILYTDVEFTAGETVFDVLQRACSDYGIQIEYSYNPVYGSDYIEGINNLYEFDCGSQSGWMYQVDGWFPNYGVSAYTLSGGESITLCYTCDLGSDVGGGV